MLTPDELAALRERMDALSMEHRDLDDAIDVMSQAVYVDQLQLKRLKKRKLVLKDTLARMRSLLIPDLNA
jgi:hypothetical protein